jgi:hypothetical protein
MLPGVSGKQPGPDRTMTLVAYGHSMVLPPAAPTAPNALDQ